ncbi:hypothetical protein AVEN_13246-1 [Araneus ventricosus]|uniref:Uncharacterized protein n=1 Tax=Araneus ventricosus TaxID=182803 RepID=A0A4Y2DKL3_ARAVE|nr:hypothetical protein AVEN_13246-1 [Araneus ventricosus]
MQLDEQLLLSLICASVESQMTVLKRPRFPPWSKFTVRATEPRKVTLICRRHSSILGHSPPRWLFLEQILPPPLGHFYECLPELFTLVHFPKSPQLTAQPYITW